MSDTEISNSVGCNFSIFIYGALGRPRTTVVTIELIFSIERAGRVMAMTVPSVVSNLFGGLYEVLYVDTFDQRSPIQYLRTEGHT